MKVQVRPTPPSPGLHGNPASLTPPSPPASKGLSFPFPRALLNHSSVSRGSHVGATWQEQGEGRDTCCHPEARLTSKMQIFPPRVFGKFTSQPVSAPITVFKRACTRAQCTSPRAMARPYMEQLGPYSIRLQMLRNS